MISPIISLFIPIILLIIPFFIIKLRGLTINFEEYLKILKVVIKNNALGKLFTEFNNVTVNEKIYLLISAGFYVFSFYQNIMTCYNFNKNMIKINNYLFSMKNYLIYTIQSMNNYLSYSHNLKSQKEFNENIINKIQILEELKDKLETISDYKLSNIKKYFEIGKLLKFFYQIYDNENYNDADHAKRLEEMRERKMMCLHLIY